MGFFTDRVPPDFVHEYVHEGLLLVIALTVAAMCVVGATLLIHPAPAVSIGLTCTVVAGVVAFPITSADGPHGVPEDVALAASAGLVLSGVIGAIATRGHPPSMRSGMQPSHVSFSPPSGPRCCCWRSSKHARCT